MTVGSAIETSIDGIAPVPPVAAQVASPHRRGRRIYIGAPKPLSPRRRALFAVFSFLLPLVLWSAVSYVPFLWHPLVAISDPGAVDYLEKGMRLDRGTFATEVANAKAAGTAQPRGTPANPVYLPAPHEVAVALYNLMEDAATAEICRTQARPCCRCRGDLKCWCVTCTASTCPAFIGEWECYMHS